jgi:hypothetical protein
VQICRLLLPASALAVKQQRLLMSNTLLRRNNRITGASKGLISQKSMSVILVMHWRRLI